MNGVMRQENVLKEVIGIIASAGHVSMTGVICDYCKVKTTCYDAWNSCNACGATNFTYNRRWVCKSCYNKGRYEFISYPALSHLNCKLCSEGYLNCGHGFNESHYYCEHNNTSKH